VLADDEPIALGGAKQKAVLAVLLMNPNRVAATSRLLQALWDEDAPKSARKILQNAIWSLRRALRSAPADLRTQAPGYLLRVDDDEIDMHRFLRLAKQGRTALSAGQTEQAARLLGEALALWRGPALADLVESGPIWPEVTALQNARLDAMEDYFDAELALGRHDRILDSLELMVENEPLRERSCCQLMLALYRSERQADALRVYAKVRSALIDELGLEPGHELRSLQNAILTQDPRLAPRPKPAAAAAETGIVMIKTELAPDFRRGPDDACSTLELLDATLREQVTRFGGTVAACIGSTSLVFFQPEDTQDSALRAVRAVTETRDRLVEVLGPARHSLGFHAVVTTGSTSDRATMTECEQLLSLVPAGEIWVSGRAHQLTASSLAYQPVSAQSTSAWRVRGQFGTPDRTSELDLLRRLQNWVSARVKPHLVTVLGGLGTGKSQLLDDFRLQAMADARVERLSATAGDHALLLAAYGGGRPAGRSDGHSAGRSTTVLLIDDLQHGSDPMLDLVEELTSSRREAPLLIVAATTPELLRRRPDWGVNCWQATTLTLSAGPAETPAAAAAPRRAAAAVL
jgi:DNA-binding SARP family transcriptional activator